LALNEINMSKEAFLKTELPALCGKLDANQKGKWGVMNAQQMVEHMSESFRIANGRFPHQIVLTPEQVTKAYSFIMSDKPFRENTKNQLLPDTPRPVLHESMDSAIKELRDEIAYFFRHFDENKDLRVTNPFFGDLSREEWIHGLHKHAVHHLKQFNLHP